MKTTLTFSDFCDAFRDMGRNDNFSYAGKRALFDFLEELAPDMELDVVALCCEYYESDLDSLIGDYDIDVSDAEDGDERADIVKEFLQENTCLVARIGTDFVYAVF